jgi:hypothetical protein
MDEPPPNANPGSSQKADWCSISMKKSVYPGDDIADPVRCVHGGLEPAARQLLAPAPQ